MSYAHMYVYRTVAIVRRLDQRESCIRGHHIYKDITNSLDGEVLQCDRGPHKNSGSILKKGIIVDRWTFTVKTDCLL